MCSVGFIRLFLFIQPRSISNINLVELRTINSVTLVATPSYVINIVPNHMIQLPLNMLLDTIMIVLWMII